MYVNIDIIHSYLITSHRDLVAERRSHPELDIELWERATYPSGVALRSPWDYWVHGIPEKWANIFSRNWVIVVNSLKTWLHELQDLRVS